MRTQPAVGVCLVAAFCLVVGSASAVTQYTITDLGTLPGGGETEAHGVNDLGGVVGQSWTSSAWHAFFWENGVMTDLTTLGGSDSYAYGVNNAGEVVGFIETAVGDSRAFLWKDGQVTDLGTVAGPNSAAWGINDSGQVVGYSNYVGGPSYRYHACVWENGAATDLGTLGGQQSCAYAINGLGQVVGKADGSPGSDHAFLWLPEAAYGLPAGMNDLGAGGLCAANDINGLGQVVGDWIGDNGRHGFLWQDGVITDLGALPGATSSYAYGINDSGRVVGVSGADAFVWENGVMTNLNDLIAPGSDWDLFGASDINERGQIVGYGKLGYRLHAFLLTPIPEPSVVLLFLLGVSGVVLRWRRVR